MKKFTLWAAVAAAVLGTGSVSALQNHRTELSPMILVELQASMKADMLYAERMIRLDLRDTLQAQSEDLAKLTIEAPVQFVLKRTNGLEKNWSNSADE